MAAGAPCFLELAGLYNAEDRCGSCGWTAGEHPKWRRRPKDQDELEKRGTYRTAEGQIVDKDTGAVVGMKFDEDKLRYDLLPTAALEGLVNIVTFGAQKYGPENWKQVKNARNRYFAAAMRHMWAWFKGQTNDPDSGRPHLWHALCNVAFLAQLEDENKL